MLAPLVSNKQPKFISNLPMQNLSLIKFRQFFKPNLLKSQLSPKMKKIMTFCIIHRLYYLFLTSYVVTFCVRLYPNFIIPYPSYIHFQLIKFEGVGLGTSPDFGQDVPLFNSFIICEWLQKWISSCPFTNHQEVFLATMLPPLSHHALIQCCQISWVWQGSTVRQ